MEGHCLSDCVIAEARSWVGTPYKDGHSLKGIGCDCVGLLEGLWLSIKGGVPDEERRTARDWHIMEPNALSDVANRYLTKIDDPEPGALVVLSYGRSGAANHCGVLGENTLIHASNARALGRGRVVEVPFSEPLKRRVFGYWRF